MSAVVLRGDAAHLPLPDESVDLLLCSPPYWSLRSYADGGEHYDGQIGSEATPAEYIAALLGCTREWVRVLKPGGSLFVNLGDKYAQDTERSRNGHGGALDGGIPLRTGPSYTGRRDNGVPRKSLLGLPWRYALGCVDQLGLILRAEIIWDKPNGLPESVTDRVRRSHEQVFHFTRQQRYFSAVDEIREPHEAPGRQAGGNAFRARNASIVRTATGAYDGQNPLGKLPGSVWEIPSQPLTVPARLGVDHFAAFPMELPRRCILGWSPPGICTGCAEGRRPVASAVALDMSRPQARRAQALADQAGLTEAHLQALLSVGVSDTGRGAATQNGTGRNTPEVYALAGVARAALGGYAREYLLRRPTGFSYACACTPFHWREDDSARWKVYHFDRWTPPPTRPAVVLDPFGGTGTTALVADVLGRTGITVDRSADYCRLAQWRTTDPGERARAMQVPKPPPISENQRSLFDDLEAS